MKTVEHADMGAEVHEAARICDNDSFATLI
jgi:hypothetical protein